MRAKSSGIHKENNATKGNCQQGKKETTRILEEVNKTNKAVIKEEKTAPRKEKIEESKPSTFKEKSLVSEMFRSQMRNNK